jgi:hypothetical protein
MQISREGAKTQRKERMNHEVHKQEEMKVLISLCNFRALCVLCGYLKIPLRLGAFA